MNAADIHARIATVFPSLAVDGWSYKGFRPVHLTGLHYRLRFEKAIAGRPAFCNVQIAHRSLFDPEFGLRDFIVQNLQEQERVLVESHRRALDGAAA